MSFLGIKINPDIARQLSTIEVPGIPETASEYHITILCFEKDFSIDHIANAVKATYNVVQDVKPFTLTLEQITSFPKFEDNPIPIIASNSSDELQNLRTKLCHEFDELKIPYNKKFKEYKPHITLAYAEQDSFDDFEIDKIEFSVHDLVLFGGDHGDDRLFVNFQLQKPKKHAYLHTNINLFEKFSNRAY